MNYAARIADAEKAQLPAVLASHEARAQARKVEPQTLIALELAEDRVHEIRVSAGKLAEKFTAADLAEAHAAVELATLRRAGAQAWRERVEKSVRSSDTTLTEVCEQVAEMAYPHTTIHKTFADLPGMPKSSELPTIVIQQQQATNLSKDGYVGGQAVLHYFRSEVHRELDSRRIEAAVNEAGASVEVIGKPAKVKTAGEITHESVRLKVHAEAIGFPYLPAVQPYDHHRLPSAVAAAIAAEVSYFNQPVTSHVRSLSYASSLVVTMADGQELVSEAVDDGGLRTLVLDASVLVYVRSAEGPATELAERIAAVESHFNSGVMIGTLGRVDHFEFLTPPPAATPAAEKREHLARVQRLKGSPEATFSVDTGQEAYLPVYSYPFRATLVSSERRPHVEPVAA